MDETQFEMKSTNLLQTFIIQLYIYRIKKNASACKVNKVLQKLPASGGSTDAHSGNEDWVEFKSPTESRFRWKQDKSKSHICNQEDARESTSWLLTFAKGNSPNDRGIVRIKREMALCTQHLQPKSNTGDHGESRPDKWVATQAGNLFPWPYEENPGK